MSNYIAEIYKMICSMPDGTTIRYMDPDCSRFNNRLDVRFLKVSTYSWDIIQNTYHDPIMDEPELIQAGTIQSEIQHYLYTTPIHHMSSSEVSEYIRDLNERYIKSVQSENPNLMYGAFQITFGKDNCYSGDYRESLC